MLSEKARSQQTALWELVETEVAYIRTLKVIQDVINFSLLHTTAYYNLEQSKRKIPRNFSIPMYKVPIGGSKSVEKSILH